MAYRRDRVATTDRARDALRDLIEQHGPILLYLSESSTGDHSPHWLLIRDFRAREGDALLGRLAWHTEFWVSAEHYATYARKHVTVDVQDDTAPADPPAPGRGVRFRLRTRQLSAAEVAALETTPRTGNGSRRKK
ncbi:DUF779 domain-containing protein [Nocardia paucivorans]|uniref:DUF779 domain-containing protein n=1 Tax=Nocardia paucivorans TaxID=114259 RepID=UPI0002D9625C|nr:DUF779 domain-containing protein [Nocardia paucivorans]